LGQPSLWLGHVIALLEPLGFQERAIRTALFRLAADGVIRLERHGRRSLCRLQPAAASALLAARQRLNMPPLRSFEEHWTMLVNSGGLGAARYAAARKHLQQLDFCQLAPNVLARPASYGHGGPPGLAPAELAGLARFDIDGMQLAAAVRQPLFGRPGWDLGPAEEEYNCFQQRFAPMRQQLGRRAAFSDAEAFVLRLLVSHGYQHCRLSDPLLPQELLPSAWPAMAAYQTYMALYAGCARQAQRHLQAVTATLPASQPDTPLHSHTPLLPKRRHSAQEHAA
jgi:phenylacetic acid degradation operon negative regulatory protein